MAKSVNDVLVDDSIIAQLRLLRYTESEITKVIRVINKLQKDVTAEIINIDPTAVTRTNAQRNRLEKLNKSVGELSDQAYRNIRIENNKDLNGYAQYQTESIVRNMNIALGIEAIRSGVSDKKLLAIVDNSMIDGRVIGKWWNKQSNTFKDKFSRNMQDVMLEFQLGSIKGQGLNELVKRVSPHSTLMNYTRKEAEALVTTSFMQVASDTRMATYKENEDLFKFYQQISTLDTRTTPICRAYDHLLWDKNFKPVGHKFPWKSGPPRHWRCRSTVIVILKSYDELTEVSSKFKDAPPKKRAAMNGSVPAETNYNAWLKTQSKAIQLEALGPGRYKLWKDNNLSMANMIHQNGRPLTIKQLKQRY